MRLAVVAYPHMDSTAAAEVERFRAQHDPLAHRIPAHFTLVFPTEADAVTVAVEIRRVAASSVPIDFTLARIEASTGIDGRCYVFLEPVEGRSSIEMMHDRLYSGMLAANLLHDVEYVPHLTVAVSTDAQECDGLADELRGSWRPTSGRIVELVLLDLGDDPFRTVEVFRLDG